MYRSLLVLALALGAYSNAASACSCATHENLEEQLRQSFDYSTAIFEAQAVEISFTTVEIPDRHMPKGKRLEGREVVVWQVRRTWKGRFSPRERVETSTNIECCMCGLTVHKGDEYVLHLSGAQPYSINSCSASKLLKIAAPDIPILRSTCGLAWRLTIRSSGPLRRGCGNLTCTVAAATYLKR